MEIAVDSSAMFTDSTSDEARPSFLPSAAYHLSDHSGAGRLNTAELLSDTITVTTKGASM